MESDDQSAFQDALRTQFFPFFLSLLGRHPGADEAGQKTPDLKIIEADKDVYEVLEMIGLGSLIPVTKKMRKISIDPLKKLGEGFHGKI